MIEGFVGGLLCGLLVSVVFILVFGVPFANKGPQRRGVSRMITTVLRRDDEAEQNYNRWEAHVLQLGVITYGESANHAVAMAEEAACMCYEDDLASGHVREGATEEEWAEADDLPVYLPSELNNLPDEHRLIVVDHTIFINYIPDGA